MKTCKHVNQSIIRNFYSVSARSGATFIFYLCFGIVSIGQLTSSQGDPDASLSRLTGFHNATQRKAFTIQYSRSLLLELDSFVTCDMTFLTFPSLFLVRGLYKFQLFDLDLVWLFPGSIQNIFTARGAL